jgi:hypothetical protein
LTLRAPQLGCLVLGLWTLVSGIVSDDDPARVALMSLPYSAFFELGVLSRYLPGVKSVAKKSQ